MRNQYCDNEIVVVIVFANRFRGTSERPRLSVRRSHKHIYAQVIDDVSGKTVVAAATVEPQLKSEVAFGGNRSAAVAIGERLWLSVQKQLGCHESVLIVVLVGIMDVLQHWPRLHVKQV